MTTLKRITTEYVAHEDRVRISGERADTGAPLVLWLTQRLLNRMLPVLLQWLESEGGETLHTDSAAALTEGRQQDRTSPRAKTLHNFAQQAARAEITPQPPVRIDARTQDCLVHSVDVGSNEQMVRLSFKGADGPIASLTFTRQQLRQWLSILQVGWRKAEWPNAVWPEWLRADIPTRQQAAVLH